MKENEQIFDSVHLQWFGDPEMVFEEPEEEEEDDTEIIVLNEGEEPPAEEDDPETATLKKQLAELQAKANDTDRLGSVIGQQIANAVKTTNRPVNEVPVQQPRESDDDFAKRFEDEVFKPGRAVPMMQELILRTASPAFNRLVGTTVEQSKKLLKLDPNRGPVFNRLEDEIEERRAALPYGQKNDPEVYQRLLDEVEKSHPELAEERFNRAVQDAVAETLKKLGVSTDASTPAPKARPTYTESGGSRTASTPTKKKKVWVTENDRQAAMREGVDIRTYMQMMKR